MLSANGALADIIGCVGIYAWPIHCLSHLTASCLYRDILHADQQGCKLRSSRGMQTLVPLRRRPESIDGVTALY